MAAKKKTSDDSHEPSEAPRSVPATPSASLPHGAPAGLILTTEQVELLESPLPEAAVGRHPSKSFLSTIKAIYVTERLNRVFGHQGWRHELVDRWVDGKFKCVLARLVIGESLIVHDTFGGNDNIDPGDAWKGAMTDSLTKAASYLGIGAEVFKGESTPSKAPGKASPPKGPSREGRGDDVNTKWIYRPAKHDGQCSICGAGVTAGDDAAIRKVEGKWRGAHPECAREDDS